MVVFADDSLYMRLLSSGELKLLMDSKSDACSLAEYALLNLAKDAIGTLLNSIYERHDN